MQQEIRPHLNGTSALAIGLTAALLGLACAAPAVAADDTTPPSSEWITGDRLKLKSKIYGLKPVKPGDTVDKWALQRTELRVTSDIGDGKIYVSILQVPCDGQKSAVEPLTLGLAPPVADSECAADPTRATLGDIYEVTKESLRKTAFSRIGFTYGVLIVPFKYFKHDKSIEPSQTVGPYVGYRWGQVGWGTSVIFSAGAATMKLSEAVDDPKTPGAKTTKENTVLGYSYSAGVLLDIDKSARPFQLGLVIGKDHVGTNSALTYKHDNKWWVAAQIGWELK